MKIARLPANLTPREYRVDELAETQAGNATLIKLPSFPNAEPELLDQYVRAFTRVIESADEILSSPAAQEFLQGSG